MNGTDLVTMVANRYSACVTVLTVNSLLLEQVLGSQGRGRGNAVAALEARIQAIKTAYLAPTRIREVTTDQTNANQTGTGSGFGCGLHQRGRGGGHS